MRRKGVGKGKKESDRERRKEEGGRGETTSAMDYIDFLETLKLIIMLLKLQPRFHQDQQ